MAGNLSGLGCAQAGPFRFAGFWRGKFGVHAAAPSGGVWARSGRPCRMEPGVVGAALGRVSGPGDGCVRLAGPFCGWQKSA